MGMFFLWVCFFNGQVFLMGIIIYLWSCFFFGGIIASNPGLFVRYLDSRLRASYGVVVIRGNS